MKHKIYFPIFFLLITSLFFNGCKKDPTKDAKLPPITQEGKNTVGFTINDEVWVPYAKCSAFSNPCKEVSARYGASGGAAPNGIDFGFERIRNGKMSYLLISSPFVTITSVGEKIDSIGVSFTAENSTGNDGYFTGPLSGSKFLITRIDFSTQIISGEFEFILRENNGSGNTITIKDGRFDFKFNACKCSQ